MTISVALAAFRGEKFIKEQLLSITTQSMPPSEVVVFDDVSDDETFEVVRDFASKSGIRIVACRQPQNRGLIENFESTIQATTGDIVFLSDQDDVWNPRKIEKVVETFDRNPSVGLVFSDAELVDQGLRPLGRTLWQSIGFTEAERVLMRSTHAFDLLLRRFLVTGATLAFRRSLLDIVLPLSKRVIHDAWIALAIAAVSRIEFIHEPLIQYRQHSGQQIGDRDRWRSWWSQLHAAKAMPPKYLHEQQMFFYDLDERLNEHRSRWVHSSIGELAKQKLRHLERRIEFREHRFRSLPALVSEFTRGEYSRFSYGWKSAAQDLFL